MWSTSGRSDGQAGTAETTASPGSSPSLLLGGGDSAGSATGPFSLASCRRRARRCSGARNPVRVAKTVVRPNRRNGGTAVVFSLTRRALVRFTIVRVYPSCERVGTFSVRAHRGLNRVRFRGRFRGRPLPEGTYRLLVHPDGRSAAAAAVTVVVVYGQTSAAEVRRARNANACSPAEAREIVGAASGHDESPTGAAGEQKRASVIDRVAGAVKGVTKNARKVTATVGAAVQPDDPLSNPFVLAIVGLLTLSSALLGTLVLVRVARGQRLR